MKTMFYSKSGQLSSKRINGSILLLVGLIMSSFVLHKALTTPAIEWSGGIAQTIILTIFGTAGAMLGSGVLEKK